jgi:hypothetical protein
MESHLIFDFRFAPRDYGKAMAFAYPDAATPLPEKGFAVSRNS